MSKEYGAVAFDWTRRAMHCLARILAVVGLALTMGAAQGQVSEVARRGHALSQELDAMNVERLWLSGRDVDEKTGATRTTPVIKDGSLTHCGAFVAAACARLGVDLLGRVPEPRLMPCAIGSARRVARTVGSLSKTRSRPKSGLMPGR